jgi:hypothetical protein
MARLQVFNVYTRTSFFFSYFLPSFFLSFFPSLLTSFLPSPQNSWDVFSDGMTSFLPMVSLEVLCYFSGAMVFLFRIPGG